MKFAYADPPYYNQGARHYDHPEWDKLSTHKDLIDRLVEEFPDGWALSASSPSLRLILPFCPMDIRIAAWVKTFGAFKRGVRPAYMWEPVIFRGGRNPPWVSHPPPERNGKQTTPKDFHACQITLKKGLTGAKPESFCNWVLDLLNYHAGEDELVDLFPGTGVMTRVLEART